MMNSNNLDIDLVIEEIILSYSEITTNIDVIKNIKNQMLIDYHRMNIYFNSIKYSNYNDFKTMIRKYKIYKNPIMVNLYILILMLLTQASFYYPLYIMDINYTSYENNFQIVAANDMPSIDIIEENNKLKLIYYKSFKCINVQSETIVNQLYTIMEITIELYTSIGGMMSTEFHYSKPSNCTIYWNEK